MGLRGKCKTCLALSLLGRKGLRLVALVFPVEQLNEKKFQNMPSIDQGKGIIWNIGNKAVMYCIIEIDFNILALNVCDKEVVGSNQ